MIIKGGGAGNVGFWGNHLQEAEKNERAEVVEIKGLAADDLKGALREMQAVAAGSRSQGNFMYQANMSPRIDEHLSPEQWQQAWDTLEKNLGLEGHQRVIVEHEKGGRVHQHAIWNRVDVDTMRVADIGGNYRTHEQTARQLEKAFDLAPTPIPPVGERKAAPELWEQRAEERSGIMRAEIRQIATEAWQTTTTGKEFVAAIKARDLKIARGDRRDFVLVDQAGDVHSLARRVDGVKAADIRERMQDVDREAMPSVQEARQTQRERFPHVAPEKRTMDAVEPSSAASMSEIAQVASISTTQERDIAKVGFDVVNSATGALEKLADIVADFFAASPAPAMAPDQAERMAAQARAADALENMAADIERGKPIGMDDVRNLTPDHLRDIRDHGDDYLRAMVERMHGEREREQAQDRGRALER